MRGISIFMVFAFVLFTCQSVFSTEINQGVLGDVFGSGKAEVKTIGNKWVDIKDRVYPIIPESNLRTANGKASIAFKDGSRVEVGNNTEIAVAGLKGSYTINLTKGSVGFSVLYGASLAVTTPTTIVEVSVPNEEFQRIASDSTVSTRGVVIFDGKGTKVINITGNILVKDASGSRLQMLASGKSVYVSSSKTGYRIVPVQAVGEEGGAGPSYKGLILAGAGLIAIGLGIYAVHQAGKTKGVASPSTP